MVAVSGLRSGSPSAVLQSVQAGTDEGFVGDHEQCARLYRALQQTQSNDWSFLLQAPIQRIKSVVMSIPSRMLPHALVTFRSSLDCCHQILCSWRKVAIINPPSAIKRCVLSKACWIVDEVFCIFKSPVLQRRSSCWETPASARAAHRTVRVIDAGWQIKLQHHRVIQPKKIA